MNAVHALEIRDATIPFGSSPGLTHLSLLVARGERVALIGPSGAGKTSILRAAAGLQAINAGRVLIGGRDVTAHPPDARGAVYLHQSPTLFPHLSVQDNVGFPLEVRGVDRRAARGQAMAMLAHVQLTAFARRSVGDLSGGQRHRVALARALAASPTALLLDEPFAALDPALRSEVRAAAFAAIAEVAGAATLIVTHDVDEAAACADRVIVLLGGRVAQDGPPAELLARPASIAVARFLGLPNIVPGVADACGTFRSALGRHPAHTSDGAGVAILRVSDIQVRLASDRRQAAPAPGDAQCPGADGCVTAVTPQVSGIVVRVAIGAITVTGIACEQGLAPGDMVSVRVRPGPLHVVSGEIGTAVSAEVPGV